MGRRRCDYTRRATEGKGILGVLGAKIEGSRRRVGRHARSMFDITHCKDVRSQVSETSFSSYTATERFPNASINSCSV